MRLADVIKQLQEFQDIHGGAIKVKVAGEDVSTLEVVPADSGLPAYVDFTGK
jgi:hypothetical protein